MASPHFGKKRAASVTLISSDEDDASPAKAAKLEPDSGEHDELQRLSPRASTSRATSTAPTKQLTLKTAFAPVASTSAAANKVRAEETRAADAKVQEHIRGRLSGWKYGPTSVDSQIDEVASSTRDVDSDPASLKARARQRAAVRRRLTQRPVHALSPSNTPETEPMQAEADSEEEGQVDDSFARELASFKSAYAAPKRSNGKGKAAAKEYTPLEQQWLDLKAANKDTVLAFEVGYKIQFWNEDALIASKILHIANFQGGKFNSAMVPTHRLMLHVKRLVMAGYKVGIVRQVETAALKKVGSTRNQLFKRQITERYTLSTWVDELDSSELSSEQGRASTIVVVLEDGMTRTDGKTAFAVCSVTPGTGEIIWDSFDDDHLRHALETRLMHLAPGEVIVPIEKLSSQTESVIATLVNNREASQPRGRIDRVALMSTSKHVEKLMEFYEQPKDVIDLDGDHVEPIISMEIIKALPETVKVALSVLIDQCALFFLQNIFLRPKSFLPFGRRAHMTLTGQTLRNLEIFQNQTDGSAKGTLWSALDSTQTVFGRRMLKHWLAAPLIDPQALQERLKAVTEILTSSSFVIGKLRTVLTGLPDLERGLCRVHYRKITLPELSKMLSALSRVSGELQSMANPSAGEAVRSPLLKRAINTVAQSRSMIERFLNLLNLPACQESRKESMFKDVEARAPAVFDAQDVISTIEFELDQHLAELRKLLKKPRLKYIDVHLEKYLIEISRSDAASIPADWIRINGTNTNYRYRSPRMTELLAERAQSIERRDLAATEACHTYLDELGGEYVTFRAVIRTLAELDCLLSLARTSSQPGYCKPVLQDNDTVTLHVTGGRHPVIERILSDPFVANDVSMDDQQGMRTMLLTGSNMSGKSSFARMCALLVILAQIGCYVPASSMRLSIFDNILTRMGAADDILHGRSTFMVEMSESADIVRSATSRSFVLLDELGRGTSDVDGRILAYAILRYLHAHRKGLIIFVTHFHSLVSELCSEFPQDAASYHMQVLETSGSSSERIVFLYKLAAGLASRSHGIHVGKIAGLPDRLLERAYEKSAIAKQADQARLLRSASNLLASFAQGSFEADQARLLCL
ncbi:uncharacterized protein L969DRAFT_54553 [Mixia osmundae IAM 14324]|uniref:MutS protein homolog 3 n=1 Tax=Mixia osmundae (strain CBS 9802 / IAM 14324 / JCM 22182 / KY 12970) TaxID=764103 RepID=G7E1K3_MIXOS|nr:uncharacterized protein L969DRAFT_54553 [Mixia osmundae IAM 14324]KEI36665.1 hypothetical protein L969DRAFT_54553 [Mixia osmundae IAM 14324]GAA96713.1 hypothetical protein E5Q_03384 [Mixia osmundae IAM 14324]